MVFFDEAGNTGDNLLDINQPTFTLASHDLTLEEVNHVLKPLYSIVKSNELHFKNLAKRPRYQKELVALLNNDILKGNRSFTYIVHKEFSIIIHIVDRLIEHVMYMNGIDLYQQGQNLTMANMMYILYKSVWMGDFQNICRLFVLWVRQKTVESCDTFYRAVFNFFEKIKLNNIIGDEFIGFIVISHQYRNEIQNGFDETYTLDPTLSTFRASCNSWLKKYPEKPEVIFDVSKPIKHFLPIINMLKAADEKIVGYGKRKYQFKLNIGELRFENSHQFPQIQLADLVASSLNICAKELASGRELSGFIKDIYDSFLFQDLSGDAMWPSDNVTPESIGMKDAKEGVNPLDHFVDELIKQGSSRGDSPV